MSDTPPAAPPPPRGAPGAAPGSAPRSAPGSAPLVGMGLMLAAVLMYAGMGTCFRLAMQDGVPLPLLPFARGVVTLALLAPWLIRNGARGLATRRARLHALRSIAGIASFGLYLVALAFLPLADAIAIMQARPLWALPLAVLFLKETLRRDRVLAALLGFVGVVAIARPGGQISGEAMLGLGLAAAVASGITGALVLICMKRLAVEPAPRVVAWYAIANLVVWGPVSALVWHTPGWGGVALLVAGSALAVAGDLLTQQATRRAEVGLLAPMEYAAIPVTAALGFWLFAEQPGWGLALGTALMLGATLWLVRGVRRG